MSGSATGAPGDVRHGSWSGIGSVSPGALHEAALELHRAVQLIASAGRTFVEPRADHSHMAMAWDEPRHSFVGAPFAGAYPFRVALRPMDLTLQLLDRTDQPLGSLPLAGHAGDEAYSWLSLGLATYMGGPPPVLTRPDYDMPPHPVAAGEPFSGAREAERAALAALYGGAAGLLSELAGARTDASAVVCWPHHFEIATLIRLDGEPAAEDARTIGVGMAPFGAGSSGWYWYVTPWPYPEASSLPALDAPGAWHVEGWTGAELGGDEVVATPPSERRQLVRDFIDRAIAACVTVLSG
jgi:hypothetical protein